MIYSRRPQPQIVHRQTDHVVVVVIAVILDSLMTRQQIRHHIAIRTHFHQLESLHFPARRARNLLDKDHPSRQRLVAGKLVAGEAVYFVAGQAVACCGLAAHDKGAHELVVDVLFGGAFLFDADDGCVDNAGVFEEDAFDFGGCNLPSTRRLEGRCQKKK